MFIVLEGLDGAGKSTQLKALEAYYQKLDRAVRFMHFPQYETPVFGELIARFLSGDCGPIDTVDPYLVALLFAGNRFQLSSRIKECLDEGSVVLLDRYVYSNVAFQGAKLKTSTERNKLRDWILNMEFNYFKLPRPDVNLFLDVPISFIQSKLREERKGEDRNYLKGKKDIHEASVQFQATVREVYLDQAARDDSFRVVPCANERGDMASWEDIFERIIAYVK